MKIFVQALLLMLVTFGAAHAEVTATLDRNPVTQGETVTLTIRVVDEKGEPDLGVLSADFRVLGQNTSSQVQYSNGSVSKWKDWNVQLLPKRSGSLTIPAIPVGQARTQPISLMVNEQDQRGPREAWIEFEVDPQTVWQGQQILVDVALYYASSVRSGELSAPELNNGIIEQIGDDQTEQTVKNGVRYNRLVRRYVVFPERAGDFVIRAPVFSGQADSAQQSNRGFGGLFRSTRHVSAAADDITVNVKSVVPGSDFWLPAQDVMLTARWGDSDAQPVFRVGEPVTRVVTLTAYGLLATQLPDLELDYSGLRAYPEAAEQDTRGTRQGVVGIRHYRTAIIPQAAGQYRLPPQQVKWWDVSRGEWATAELPAETIEVLPAEGAAPIAPVAAEPCEPVVISESAPQEIEPLQCDEAVPVIVEAGTGWWKWLAFSLGGLWLLTCLLWWLSVRKKPTKPMAQQRVNLAAAKNKLIDACKRNDREGAISTLATLAREAGLAAAAPAAVAAKVTDPVLKAALTELDAAKYGQAGNWDGSQLSTALQASAWPMPETQKAVNGLPELYP